MTATCWYRQAQRAAVAAGGGLPGAHRCCACWSAALAARFRASSRPCIASALHLRLLVWRAPLRHPGLGLSASLRKSDPASCASFIAALIRARGACHKQPRFQKPLDPRRDRRGAPSPAAARFLVRRLPPEGSRSPDGPQQLTLMRRGRPEAFDLGRLAIVTGRPHQIASTPPGLGAPLAGRSGCIELAGGARDEALPGEGGYTLRPTLAVCLLPGGEELALEAPFAGGPAQLRPNYDQPRER